jgi:molybdate transport system substrate-binding protein
VKTGYVVALAMLGAMGIGTVSVPVAQADELKVLSAGIMHFALKDVGNNFTGRTGTKLAITFGGAGVVKTRVEKDEPVDVVILPKPDIAALAKAGKIAPDSVHDIAHTALSIAVRKGQPKPDISSLAAVKEALLAANTIAYYSAAAGGADGILAERDSARLGIANKVAAKATLWKSVQEAIAEKSADLIIGWQPALLSKAADYEFVGPLPPELQYDPEHSTWTAGAATKAADLEGAKAFTQFLASPESLGVFTSKGFTPP